MRFSRENLLRPDEVAVVLGATPKTLANWRCERRGPPFLKIGRQAFYPLDSLNRWLDQQEHRQTKGSKKYADRKQKRQMVSSAPGGRPRRPDLSFPPTPRRTMASR
jgi:hypothetical protein